MIILYLICLNLISKILHMCGPTHIFHCVVQQHMTSHRPVLVTVNRPRVWIPMCTITADYVLIMYWYDAIKSTYSAFLINVLTSSGSIHSKSSKYFAIYFLFRLIQPQILKGLRNDQNSPFKCMYITGLPRSMPNADQCGLMPIKIMALIRNAQTGNIHRNKQFLGLHVQKAYTSVGTSCHNAYTKFRFQREMVIPMHF